MPTQTIPNWWKKVKLGEVCLNITDWKHWDCNNEKDSWYYFISCKDIYDWYIHYKNARQITKKDFLGVHKRTKLEKGDILITNSWTIGRLAIAKWNKVKYTTFQKSVAIVKPDKNKVNNIFLYYLLEYYKQFLIHISLWTAQKNLLLKDLRNLSILLPPLPVQRKVASILSAYDELIENNNKRIKILESMGKAIFDDIMKQAEEKGELEEVRIKNIVEKISKKYKEEKHKDLPLLDLARIPRKSFNIQSFWKSDELKTWRIIFKKYDILFWSIRPYFHKVVYAPFEWITNVSVFVLRPKKDYLPSFALYTLFSDEIINFANKASWWTKMPVIKWDVLSEKPIKLPPQQTLKNFNNQVKSILDEILNLQLQNQNLKQTRDLLIPQLVSGRLDVEEMEI